MEPAFHDCLMKDRAAALDGMGLSPAEREVLIAASPEQLDGMIAQARKDPAVKSGFSYKTVAAGCAVLGGGLLLGGLLCLPAVSFGHRGRDADRFLAHALLHRISMMEEQYRYRYKRYGDHKELARFWLEKNPVSEAICDPGGYTFEAEVVGDKYRLVVRHSVDPEKHPVLVLETGGKVELLK
jgi:hypothetical protein